MFVEEENWLSVCYDENEDDLILAYVNICVDVCFDKVSLLINTFIYLRARKFTLIP